jgi:hypothetical protein
MSTGTDERDTPLAPDEAFAALGNETRMEILRTLGDADEPLTFSELRDRVGMADSGQFNYHLGKLGEHFVGGTEDGYRLQRAGKRVVEAVLSGAVTGAPVVEPTETDDACLYCGAPTTVSYREGMLARAPRVRARSTATSKPRARSRTPWRTDTSTPTTSRPRAWRVVGSPRPSTLPGRGPGSRSWR